MKKKIALLLTVVMLLTTLVSCASIRPTDDDKGAEIPVYMSGEIYNLDPAYAYLDESAAKILPLIYEGLFTLNEKGEAEKAMCKEYKTFTDRDGDFVLELTLNDTKWSDGRSVSANDFVYAWKRILEPEFASKAASLLYDVKNARDCKLGNLSIDDLGVVATENKVLQIIFEEKIDVEEFILTLASPALVPLREDKVVRLDNWASYYATMVTNGPFFVKIFIPGEGSMTLERSIYYYRNMEKENEYLDKYVTPYRLNITLCSPEEAYEKYEKGEIVLDFDLPLSAREKADAKKLDTYSTHTYIFNTTKAPFDNADVRKALSLAVDREALADLVVYAKAAGGVIPAGISDTGKKDFRTNGGNLITSDMAEAKSLVKAANVTEKNITITIQNDDVDLAVAEYVKGQWEELGFKVDIETLTFEHQLILEYDQYPSLFIDAYKTGNFDVIAIDSQMLSTNAFNELASYATDFSGSAAEFSADAHISGYASEEYNKLIEQAFAEKDAAKRSELLHKAEELLIKDMPVMPLFVYENAYVIAKDLKKVEALYNGSLQFKQAKLKNYEDYKVTTQTEE